jgi:hypothetical protein
VSRPHAQGEGPAFGEGGALLLSNFTPSRLGRRAIRSLGLLSALVLLSLGTPGATRGQVGEWNDLRVLQMVRDAREVRQGLVQDSTLRSYSSTAQGFVYFYLDRGDTGERILVKTDQIALEVYWQTPDRFKQRIVGLRDEKSLPTNIQYHMDHLVVVQDEFGDLIRIGDGDEVEAVTHPAAPGSESVYDFLLADSVTLTLPSTGDTIRVYEIQVRPQDFDAPGFVGSVYLDRTTKAIVRMSFTFTPASYVDSYLDHISISLENGLWEGRYWLPYRQSLEIRREVPYLDFPAGSVIRGSFEVGEYEINPPIPSNFFTGRTITALPPSVRDTFPFQEDIHAQLEEEGLGGFAPPPEMDEIRSLAFSIAKNEYMSGLGRSRIFLPSPAVSSALRYNRAEGLVLGAGISHTPIPNLGLALYGGFSVGRERPVLMARINGGQSLPALSLSGFWNKPMDLGPVKAISGVMNTLTSLTVQDDYTDLFFSTGLAAHHTLPAGEGNEVNLSLRWEQHRSGRDVVSSDSADSGFRPVIPVDEGVWTSIGIGTALQTPWPNLKVRGEGLWGRFKDQNFGSVLLALDYRRRWLSRGTEVLVDLQGAELMGAPPTQAEHYLGGRLSVPGYGFRSKTGDRFWLLRTEASTEVLHPFVRVRAFGAAGEVSRELLDPSPTRQTSSLLSAGLGLGLGWDILRLDLARGLRGDGDWELMLWVKKDFWPWL